MIKNIENILEDNMLDYATYVLLNRALPDVRDGLKPVHRRILYTMNMMKAYDFTKSQNIVGQVMKTHPHGDSYGSLVNMVQKDKQFVPFIDGKGNFAQHTSRDLQAAAGRYTEAKLSELSKDILKDVNNGAIDFIPNYDGTIMIPEVLPTFFPIILTYNNSGIGVGMSSSIGSFSIKELCDAIIKYIKTGEKTILVPDFPTGGYILNNEDVFKKINETGLGAVKLRSNYKINNNIIEITEIPYSTTREAIIDKIVELVKDGKLKEIVDVRDLTGLNGQLIEIVCKKNVDMELLIEKLYKNTPMESSFSFNMNMLINNLPKTVGVWTAIDEWLNWRKGCIERKLKTEIEKLNKELHLLKGFERILSNIELVIETIRFTPETEINTVLMKHFNIDEIQADEISNMKLKNINKDYINRKLIKIEELENSIAHKKNLIENGIENIICEDMTYTINKYGEERRTKLINLCESVKKKIKEIETMVEDYPVKVIITKDGYIHKYKNLDISNDNIKIKESDYIVDEFKTNNAAELLVFSGYDCYKVLIDDIDETQKGSFGTFIKTSLEIENIINVAVLDNKYKYLLIWYDNNKIAKIDLNSFITKSNRKKLSNSLNKDTKVKRIWCLDEEKQLEIITKKKTYKKETSSITLKGSRSSQGISIVGNKEILEINLI